jgi:hypothetical protein
MTDICKKWMALEIRYFSTWANHIMHLMVNGIGCHDSRIFPAVVAKYSVTLHPCDLKPGIPES